MANRLKPSAQELDSLINSEEAIENTQNSPLITTVAPPDPSTNINRANQLSRGGPGGQQDNTGNVSIGLYDIDAAIIHYWTEVIKPQVQESGGNTLIDVPLMWGNPERWKSMQVDGYVRDNKGNLILPLVMFRRTAVARDDAMMIDDFNKNLVMVAEKKYTQNFRYDNFSVLNGMIPPQELITTAVPDFITLSYECVIWTEYTEHMNPLIEKVIYHDMKYWGEENRFRFRTKTDSWDDASELSTDNDRMIKTQFNLTFNGYLVPETINEQVNTGVIHTYDQVVMEEGDTTTGKSTIIEEADVKFGDGD